MKYNIFRIKLRDVGLIGFVRHKIGMVQTGIELRKQGPKDVWTWWFIISSLWR